MMSKRLRKVDLAVIVLMVVVYDLSLRGLIPAEEPGKKAAATVHKAFKEERMT
jgi:hypothetical protein